MRIESDDLTRPEVIALLGEHESAGFARCGPFAGYAEDPHSVFMTLEILVDSGPAGPSSS